MIVKLSEVPRRERYLLYCSKLMPRQRSPRRRRRRDSSAPNEPHSVTLTCLDTPSNLIPLAAGFDAAGTAVGVA